jgi:hypothetical protein
MRPLTGLIAAALLALVFSTTETKADVVTYSTFLYNNGFDTGGGSGISGGSYNDIANDSLAAEFIPTVSGNLTTINVPVFSAALSFLPATPAPDNHFQLNLYANSATGGPNTFLSLASGVITAPTIGTIETFTNSGPTVDLQAGQAYWLALSPTEADTFGAWCFSSPTIGSTLPQLYSSDGGVTYGTEPDGIATGGSELAFSVDVAAAPEPASCTFMFGDLAAFALLTFWYRRSESMRDLLAKR